MSRQDKSQENGDDKKEDEDEEEGEMEVLEQLLSPNLRADQERKLAERASRVEAFNRESARLQAPEAQKAEEGRDEVRQSSGQSTETPTQEENPCEDDDEEFCVLQVLRERAAMPRASMENEKLHAYAGSLEERVNGRSNIAQYLEEADPSEKKAQARITRYVLDDSQEKHDAHTRSRLVQYLNHTLGPDQKKTNAGPHMVQTQTTPTPRTAVAVPATAQTEMNIVPQPGAFRGALGEDFERTDHVRYSLVGAAGIDASGLSGFATSEELSRAMSNPTVSREFASLGASGGGVVEANPVSERDITMEARPVNQEDLERRKLQKRRWHCFLGVAFVCVILAAGTICGIVLQNKGENTTNTPLSATASPTTQVPSSTPSSAPSSALDGLNAMVFPDHTMEAVQDPFSPQHLAYDWLSQHPNITFMEQYEMQQTFAMATFFHAMGGWLWPKEIRGSWLDYERPSCYWFSGQNGYFSTSVTGPRNFSDRGILPCNDNGQLLVLELNNFNFSLVEGAFIPPEVGLLTALETIRIPELELSAPISNFLSPLTLQNLQNISLLSLTGNPLSGQVPSEIGLMTKLTVLHLGGTNIAQPLPTELFRITNLEILELHDLGLDEIPSELGLLRNLRHLEAAYNNLTAFPSGAFQMRGLEVLSLGFNSIPGPVPTQLGLLKALMALDLASNEFSGHIPTELAQLENLTSLALDQNLLSGPISFGIFSAMPDISSLFLANNSLTGTIPSEMGLLSLLNTFELNSNSFTGNIPTELGMLENIFFSLDLSFNHLSGTIPSELSLLVNMTQALNLRSNSLSGSIPTELGLLPSLFGWLDLSDNLLTSTIPTELGLLPYLHSLSLDGNSITGTIPSELGQVQTLLNLGLSHLSLTGSFPNEVASLAAWGQLWQLDISNNTNFSGTLPEDLCFLQTPDCFCFYPFLCKGSSCILEFDCTDQLCGCGCDCQ